MSRTTSSTAVTIEQQINADKEIKIMIEELVSVMYNPGEGNRYQ